MDGSFQYNKQVMSQPLFTDPTIRTSHSTKLCHTRHENGWKKPFSHLSFRHQQKDRALHLEVDESADPSTSFINLISGILVPLQYHNFERISVKTMSRFHLF